MKINNPLSFQTAQDWRAWLENNHANAQEAWIVYDKAHTGRPCITYEESLDEALCFGWIDSIIQKIDEDTYGRKFTPRKNTAKWSAVNKRKVARLIREGRMTEAGLAKIDDLSDFQEDTPTSKNNEVVVPPNVEAFLKAHHLAWENFCKMATSYRRVYIGWITSAKREETLQKRLQEAVERLEQNLPLGMK